MNYSVLYKCIPYVLSVILVQIVLRSLIHMVSGIWIGSLSIFLLKLRSIKVNDNLHIGQVRYHLLRKEIIISDVKFKDITSAENKSEGGGRRFEAGKARLPPYLVSLVRSVLWYIPKLALTVENVKMEEVFMATARVEVRAVDNKVTVSILYNNLESGGMVVLKSGSLNAIGHFDRESPIGFSQVELALNFMELNLPVYRMIGKYMRYADQQCEDFGDTSESEAANSSNVDDSDDNYAAFSQDYIKRLRCNIAAASRYFSLFQKVDLFIDVVKITDIPPTLEAEVCAACEGILYEATLSNFTVQMSRFHDEQPGYNILFDARDKPIRLRATISTLQLALKETTTKDDKLVEKYLRICDIPSIILYGDTNILSETLVDLDDTRVPKTVIKMVGHISSPIVDFELEELSLLKSLHTNLQVLAALYEQEREVHLPSYTGKELGQDSILLPILCCLKQLLPDINSKITIEDPVMIVKNKSDFFIHKCSIFSIQTRSQKHIEGSLHSRDQLSYVLDTSLEILDIDVSFHSKSTGYVDRPIHIESVTCKAENQLLPLPYMTLSVDIDYMECNFSELQTLTVLNHFIRTINSEVFQVETQYFMKLYERFSDKLQKGGEPVQGKKEVMAINDIISEKLPSYLGRIKIDISDFSFIVGSRSVFMTDYKFGKLENQSPHDFIGGELRKVRSSMGRLKLILDASQSNICDGNDYPESSTTSEFSYDDVGLENPPVDAITAVEHLWEFTILCEQVVGTIYSESRRSKEALSSKAVFRMPHAVAKVYPRTDSDRVMIYFDVERLEILFSLMTLFLIFSAFQTIRQVFSKEVPVPERIPCSKRHGQLFTSKSFFNFDTKHIFQSLDFKLASKRIDIVTVLPNGVRCRFDAFQSSMDLKNTSDLQLVGYYFRMCVESPRCNQKWVRMITAVEFTAKINLKNLPQEGDWVDLLESEPSVLFQQESLHWQIPHGFEMYKIFDNISTMSKSMKQMIHTIKTSNNELVVFPEPRDPVKVPKIKFKSKRWVFSIEDDPFETTLGMIFQIGLQEQRSRLEKYDIFDEWVEGKIKAYQQDPLKRSKASSQSLVNYKAARKKKNASKKFSTIVYDIPGNNAMLESKLSHNDYELCCDRFHKLQEQISDSWIKRIQSFKEKEKRIFNDNFKFLWGRLEAARLPQDVTKDLVDFSVSPGLMTLIIEGVDIDILQPYCGLENCSSFIHEVGKGVPKDTQYSLLLPFYIDARFSELRCHLKDYPLPMAHIPRLLPEQITNDAAIHLYGDFFITEDMIRSEHEVRTIFVPLVPSATEEIDEPYYSLAIPRGLTPTKIYTNLQMNIHSGDITTATWGGSYEAAIQQTMNCFDNFSKPPLFPSLKVGFWDKIRNIFHAKLHVRWCNDGLFEVSMKGSKNPYAIGAESAGFVVGLKGNVQVNINSEEDPTKFFTSSADNIYFAIPNYFAKPLLVWCFSSENAVFIPSQDDTNLQRSAAYYYYIDMMPVANLRVQREVMYRNYIEKTAIKLSGGVSFNIGLLFERFIPGTKQRTFESRSHYSVRLSNLHTESGLATDPYTGFRSDFIHLSFTLLSNNPRAYNTMQLTPGVLNVFFSWWSSFFGNMPIRRGNLFEKHNRSPKFGEHIYSISYHADISPFFICHTYMNTSDSFQTDSANEMVEFVGLKAKMDRYLMDLHQRKEVLHERNKELDVIKRVMRLLFKEGDVSTYNIDIRTLDAIFKPAIFSDEFQTAEFNIYGDDMTWYDILDYKEFKYKVLDGWVPNVTIGQLLHAPKFVYRKQASYGDKYQVDFTTCERIEPIDNSVSHVCSLEPHIGAPFHILQDRKDFLMKEKANAERQLEVATDDNERQAVKASIEKLETVLSMISALIADGGSFEAGRGKGSRDHLNIKVPAVNYLDKTNSVTISSFENKFFLFYMRLKWNEDARDVIFRYLHLLDLYSQSSALKRSKIFKVFERLCEQHVDTPNTTRSTSDIQSDTEGTGLATNLDQSYPNEFQSQSLTEIFEEGIYQLGADMEYVTHDNHFIQFVAPQIQLSTKETPSTCILVAAPTIKMKIVDFDSNTSDNEYVKNVFMTRYAATLMQANVFIFQENEFKGFENAFFDPIGYDVKNSDNWQPWLGPELSFEPEPLKTSMIIRDFSSVFKFDRVSSFANLSDQLADLIYMDKVVCSVPRFVLSSDSKQYLALYNIVTNVFLYVEPRSARLKKQVNQLLLGYDPSNLYEYRELIDRMLKTLDTLKVIEDELSFKKYLLDDVGTSDLQSIRRAKFESFTKLSILMKVLTSSNIDEITEDRKLMFIVSSEEFILHMLYDNGEPFLDAALANSYFHRIESSTGSNSNKLVINMLQVFNLEENVKYHNLLGPLQKKNSKDSAEPLISLEWDMDRPVAGIRVVKNVLTELQGLEVKVEQHTIDNFFKWTMPEMIQELLNSNELQDFDSTNSNFDIVSIITRESITSNSSHSWIPLRNVYSSSTTRARDGSELREMVQRSSDYMIIENMVINSFPLAISYRGQGAKRLINVTDFMFMFPKLQFINQTITIREVMKGIKKVLLKSLLKHTGQFLGNKLRRIRNHKNPHEDDDSNDSQRGRYPIQTPLRQLQRYKSYTDISELRMEN
ncbi:HDL358Wp [Eremothecium sinecaudum]|uniref:HDL358Wp n=1 Tax=Eremothecium sinecaudum TaxID=45286 RepID=A0A109UYX0_9SACH|nr:HDL358Wp [Eremothecium sinecaudum]AMD20386.1 HDL358Wp [Eremothecium sinecaudum]